MLFIRPLPAADHQGRRPLGNHRIECRPGSGSRHFQRSKLRPIVLPLVAPRQTVQATTPAVPPGSAAPFQGVDVQDFRRCHQNTLSGPPRRAQKRQNANQRLPAPRPPEPKRFIRPLSHGRFVISQWRGLAQTASVHRATPLARAAEACRCQSCRARPYAGLWPARGPSVS